MLSLLIYFLVLLVVFAIVWWILSMVPIPPQFRWIANVILAIIFLIIVISLLTGNLGGVHPLLR